MLDILQEKRMDLNNTNQLNSKMIIIMTNDSTCVTILHQRSPEKISPYCGTLELRDFRKENGIVENSEG